MISSLLIGNYLGREVFGPEVDIRAPASLDNAQPNTVLFVKDYSLERVKQINRLSNVLALVPSEYEGQLSVTHILTSEPRLDFARVLQHFFAPKQPTGIESTAIVDETAMVGKDVYIGHFSVIGKGVVIGDNTVIRDHVVIRENCLVGKGCLIKSNTVIGEEGFGFEFLDDGSPVRIPHFGRVVLGNFVEIGAMNVIARGTFDDTVIADNVKTDDHVFIAHNAQIGPNSVVIAGAEISGSVTIGKNVWISPQVSIINQVNIGDGALIGIGAVVTKSVEPNAVMVGNPARMLRKRK